MNNLKAYSLILFIFLILFNIFSITAQNCMDEVSTAPPSSITVKSREGYHLPAHGTIRILIILAEVNYDVSSDPFSPWWSATWQPGQVPTWINDFVDVNTPSTGQLTQYFNLASSGNLIVLGDYLKAPTNNGVFVVNESDIINHTPGANPSFWALKDVVNTQMANGFLTFSGITDPASFDLWTRSTQGYPKINNSNLKFDNVLVIWRNDINTPNGQGNNTSSWPIITNTIMGYTCDTYTMVGANSGSPLDVVRHEFSHNLLGGNDFHVAGGDGVNFWIPRISAHAMLSLHDATLTSWSAWDRQRLDWKAPGNLYNISARNASNTMEVLGDLDASNPNHSGIYSLRDQKSEKL